MKIIYSPDHILRDALSEINNGAFVPPFECAERMYIIERHLRQSGFKDVEFPQDHGLATIHQLHDTGYLAFLESIHDDWIKEGNTSEAIPLAWPAQRMRRDQVPASVIGRLGYYGMSLDSAITANTWKAALLSASCAQSAADHLVAKETAAFSLSRPPGHHAGRDFFGGYCFLNNAGLAAQHLRNKDMDRVAVLDVDFHHGNGTQDIFYTRGDVFFTSIHGDPTWCFPYFLGHGDEIGEAGGEGANLNLPLPRGSDWVAYGEALQTALDAVADFGADALVVSLGVDTFEGDPISHFALRSDDFIRIGAAIAKTGLPTVFIMEGGYAVEEIGVNTVNVLTGFLA